MFATVPGWFGVLSALVFGLAIGSFLNVVIYRLPAGESIVHPGSRCPGCGTAIAPWDNVPVLAWLWLRGRCRHCGSGISARYPAIELATGLMFASIAWHFGAQYMTPVWMLFGAMLLAAGAIDFDHQIIPDEISLGGLAVGLVLVPGAQMLDGASGWEAARASVVGAVLGGGTLWVVGFVHARLAVAMGREFEHWPGEGEALPRPSELDYWVWFPGLGFGDVKLMAMIGAFLGPFGVVDTILAASIVGLLMGLAWAAVTRGFASPFGFGPAIAAGAMLALFLPTRAWLY